MADWKKFKWKKEKMQKVSSQGIFSSSQSILCWPVVPGDIFGTLPVAGGQIYNRPTWLEFVRYTHDPSPQKENMTHPHKKKVINKQIRRKAVFQVDSLSLDIFMLHVCVGSAVLQFHHVRSDHQIIFG